MVRPMQTGPEQAKSRLNGGMKAGLFGGDFIQKPSEIKRDNSPDQLDVVKGCDNKLAKNGPIFVQRLKGCRWKIEVQM
ncbi:MAG: hypothetical protein JWM99_280 [Verrucomicrobiales bacterium]|nr:hypothetical protein [Verrucomicrobiales bacterium]